MSLRLTLRALVSARLTAAAEDIFALFERTIAEYEQQLRQTQKTRAPQLLHRDCAADSPGEMHGAPGSLHKAGVQAALGSSDTEPPRVKEEPQEEQTAFGSSDTETLLVKEEPQEEQRHLQLSVCVKSEEEPAEQTQIYAVFECPSDSEVPERCLTTPTDTPLFLGRHKWELGRAQRRRSEDSETESRTAVPTSAAKLPSDASLPSNAPLDSDAPLVTVTFLKDHTLFLIQLMRLQLEAEGRGPPRSLQDLNQRLKLVRKSKKLLWEEIAAKLSERFQQTFPPVKVARKWNTLLEAYKKVKDHNSPTGRGPGKFQFFTEMDELLGGPQDTVPVVGRAGALDVHRPHVLQVSVSETSPASPPSPPRGPSPPSPPRGPSPPRTSSPAPSRTPSPPLFSCRAPHTAPRPRKRQREEDLLLFLRESEAASQAAAQKRHTETLAQMEEVLQRLLGRIVEKM